MSDNEVLSLVQSRAGDRGKCNDFADIVGFTSSPPTTLTCVLQTERELDHHLHPLLRRLYTEVGNGGFGPGYGIIGLEGGYADNEGRFLVECTSFLASCSGEWPTGVVPLSSWGASVWSCVRCTDRKGTVITFDESGLTETEYGLSSWLEAWVNNVNLWEQMFEFRVVELPNPFTGQPVPTAVRVKARGLPL